MNPNKTIAELMCEVSELMLTLGPRNTLKTMQHVLLNMASPPSMPQSERQQACAAEARRTEHANATTLSRTRRSAVTHAWSDAHPGAARHATMPWRYRKLPGISIAACNLAMPAATGQGKFLEGSITNDAGTRSYKLYVPSCYRGQPLPLVVMLHGCAQDPDDFALGTRMNAIAEEKCCFVVYPEQAKSASHPKCWNWFRAANQQRELGEPSIIADITRTIIHNYHVDESRVYIAGLSAGGAMAAIMATIYPELFAAAGVHSGLPFNAANDMYSALSAMKHGPSAERMEPSDNGDRLRTVPLIVFHGDADTVVHPSNGDHVLMQAVLPCVAPLPETGDYPFFEPSVMHDELPDGRSYTRRVYHDENGQIMAEQWVVHGAGHAWSGGSDDGSYTDPQGPDAANEMMRFFYEQTQAK